jgi:hypothetical protein
MEDAVSLATGFDLAGTTAVAGSPVHLLASDTPASLHCLVNIAFHVG